MSVFPTFRKLAFFAVAAIVLWLIFGALIPSTVKTAGGLRVLLSSEEQELSK